MKVSGASIPWEEVEAYASFLVRKFGTHINKKLWDATRPECELLGVRWLSANSLKSCLVHFLECERAPVEIRERAAALARQLSRPGLMTPWKKTPNKYCEYCRAPAALVADLTIQNIT